MINNPTRITELELGRSWFPRKRRTKGVWITNTNGYRHTAKGKHIPRSLITAISYSYQRFCCTYLRLTCVGLEYHKDECSEILTFRVQVVGALLLFSCQVISDSYMNPWTVARQVPLFMGFPRQEYWNGLPFPSPGDLPDPGIEPRFPALQADSLPTELQGKPKKECSRREKGMNSIGSVIRVSFVMNPSLQEGFEGSTGNFQEDKMGSQRSLLILIDHYAQLYWRILWFAVHSTTVGKYRAS